MILKKNKKHIFSIFFQFSFFSGGAIVSFVLETDSFPLFKIISPGMASILKSNVRIFHTRNFYPPRYQTWRRQPTVNLVAAARARRAINVITNNFCALFYRALRKYFFLIFSSFFKKRSKNTVLPQSFHLCFFSGSRLPKIKLQSFHKHKYEPYSIKSRTKYAVETVIEIKHCDDKLKKWPCQL